jgi:hypothetical protein
LEGLRLENVDIFYGHLEYFIDIWVILWPFGTFCVHLVHFFGFGTIYQEKSGDPDSSRWHVPMQTTSTLRNTYGDFNAWACRKVKPFCAGLFLVTPDLVASEPTRIETWLSITFCYCKLNIQATFVKLRILDLHMLRIKLFPWSLLGLFK